MSKYKFVETEIILRSVENLHHSPSKIGKDILVDSQIKGLKSLLKLTKFIAIL